MEEVKFRREYKIRRQQTGKESIEVTVPLEVIEREARLHEISVDDFIDRFIAVCEFGTDGNVHYSFAPSSDSK